MTRPNGDYASFSDAVPNVSPQLAPRIIGRVTLLHCQYCQSPATQLHRSCSTAHRQDGSRDQGPQYEDPLQQSSRLLLLNTYVPYSIASLCSAETAQHARTRRCHGSSEPCIGQRSSRSEATANDPTHRFLGPSIQLRHPHRSCDGHAEEPRSYIRHIYHGPNSLLRHVHALRPRRPTQELPLIRMPFHQLQCAIDAGISVV